MKHFSPRTWIRLLGAVYLAIAPVSVRAAEDKAVSSSNRLSVVVLAFENKSADPEMACYATGLLGSISEALHEVKTLRVSESADYALAKLNIKDPDPISESQARKGGELIEAQRVVWGDYQRKGNKWVVNVRVLNVATGKTSKQLSATSPDWFDVRDQLSLLILKQCGVRPSKGERTQMLKRTTKSPSAIEWMCKTETAYKNGRPAAESEKYVRQALDADPNCCRALCWLGAILATSGRLEEAEQTVRNGIRLCPENALAHRTLGHVLMLHQKPDEADLELQQAAQLDPDSSDIFDLRGQLYGIQGMNALALQCMKIAAELNAFSAEIRANLGYCLAKNGNRDKATDALRAAEALLLQDDVGAEQFLALGYNALHDVPSAIQHYDAFLKIAKRQGLNPEAVKDFETTLAQLRSSLEPTYLDALPPKDYSDAELAELLASRLTKDELAAVKNPLARTAEMDRWARELTQGATNDLQKARMLFDRLILRLDRKNERKARTATEVFAAWNDERSAFVCQEYANLYVALARVVGLRAYFVPVSEQFNGGKALHACAGVFVENKLLLVDPAFCWFGVPHKKFEVWDDLRAIAMNLSQSRELLKQRIACKLVPDCANFQFRLAVVLIYENQTNEVPQVLECALKLESDSATAYTARAYWEFCQRRFDQTIELVQKSLELDPYQGPAYFLLGEAFLKQGRLSEARNAWRISLSCGLPDGTSEGVHERIAQANEVLTGIAGRDEIPELKYRK